MKNVENVSKFERFETFMYKHHDPWTVIGNHYEKGATLAQWPVFRVAAECLNGGLPLARRGGLSALNIGQQCRTGFCRVQSEQNSSANQQYLDNWDGVEDDLPFISNRLMKSFPKVCFQHWFCREIVEAQQPTSMETNMFWLEWSILERAGQEYYIIIMIYMMVSVSILQL